MRCEDGEALHAGLVGGFEFGAEINDLNTFTTRVEKLGGDVGSKSDGLLLPLWLKADRLSAPGWARCARGRHGCARLAAWRGGRNEPATW